MTRVEIALPGQAGADAVALPVTQPLDGDSVRVVDDRLDGRLARLAESGELRGERGEAVLLHLNGELRHRASSPRESASATRSMPTRSGRPAPPPPRRSRGSAGRSSGSSTRRCRCRSPSRLRRSSRGRSSARTRPAAGSRRTRRARRERIVIAHAGDARAAAGRRARRARRRPREPRARPLEHAAERAHARTRSPSAAQELAREHEHLTCEVLGTRELDELGMGALTRRRPRQPQRAAPDRPPLRPARRPRRHHRSGSSASRSPSTPAASRSSRPAGCRT